MARGFIMMLPRLCFFFPFPVGLPSARLQRAPLTLLRVLKPMSLSPAVGVQKTLWLATKSQGWGGWVRLRCFPHFGFFKCVI